MVKVLSFIGQTLIVVVVGLFTINQMLTVCGNGKEYGIIWYYLFVR